MVLGVDVYYREDNSAKAVGVLFNWMDNEPIKIYEENIKSTEAYISGQFYKRELPCIIKLLEKIDLRMINCILVDGHVYVNNSKDFGLGGYLYAHLKNEIPIIGVAKNPFFKTEEVTKAIKRGLSSKSLFISSIGIELNEASKAVRSMQGEHRIPTLLKKLDRLTKD